MKKYISLILLLSLILTACSGSLQETETTENAVQTETVETVDPVSYEMQDLGGMTVRIRYFGNEATERYDAIGNDQGEGIEDTVWNRNRTVEENLNVKLEWIKGSDDWWGFPAEIENLILSGDDSHDMHLMETQKSLTQAVSGHYMDLSTSPYINLEDPWWYSYILDAIQLHPDKLYILPGTFSLNTFLYAGCTFFNKELWTDTFGDSAQLYDIVRDGEWTMEQMYTFCQDCFQDTNGDGKLNSSDIYGLCSDSYATMNYLAMCSTLSFSHRDEEGMPVLNMYSEDILYMLQQIYNLSYGDKAVYMTDGNITGVSAFLNRNSLFYIRYLNSVSQVRDAEFDWGIVPIPALYAGNGYSSAGSSLAGNSASIPVTADPKKMESLTAVLNALAVESYKTGIPTATQQMKSKYSSDEQDEEMVGIILENIRPDFILAASVSLDGLGSIFSTFLLEGRDPDTYTSYWTTNEKKYQTLLDNLIEAVRADP